MGAHTEPLLDPVEMIIPGRRISGISATLLPFREDGKVDWDAFCAHVDRTARSGLTPAVNMDTGFVNLLDEQTRNEVLSRTRETMGKSSFVAGAFVADQPGDQWNSRAYQIQIERIQAHNAVPVIFQSYGLTGQPGDQIVNSYQKLAKACEQFIAFELGKMFAPFGAIYDEDTYLGLMSVTQCIGAKHSSLDRNLEWRRLQLRGENRPDFKVYTGNDLAIDMVMYGSDYLLGLSTFAPDVFALRDKYWLEEDPRFYQVNDLLQYLGFFAFRDPVPAYKHSAAQFLKLRKWINSDHIHPAAATRPDTDIPILQNILDRMNMWF